MSSEPSAEPSAESYLAAGSTASARALRRKAASRQGVAPEPSAVPPQLPSEPQDRRRQQVSCEPGLLTASPIPPCRTSVGGGTVASRIPAARGGKLLEAERKLLLTSVDLDKGDLFPPSRRPESIAPSSRAPVLNVANDQYVELASTRRFKKLAAAAAAEQAEEHRRQIEAGSTPGAGAQVAMGTMGACIFAAQGILAGISVMQILMVPPASVNEISLHLAYAPLAVSIQSAVLFLSLVSFIGAADVFAFDARGARYTTGIAVASYAIAILMLAFELPLDFSLQAAIDLRRMAIADHLAAADGVPENFFSPLGNTTWFQFPPDIAPEDAPWSMFDFEVEKGSTLTSTRISHSTVSVWYALIIVRTIAVVLAWLALSLHASARPYLLPPFPDIRGSMSESRPLTSG
mmetsp:Transcript_25097/g.76190  ORF Transcript_25097/g.76190 Transcript_25097/m.76190 type:complete len:405 (-) Transcript_25097:650-1864(-)